MTAEASGKRRLVSLDVLRGLTVAGMILVNTQGHVAKQLGAPPITILEHSPWAGLTIADLVFPSFLMILGVSAVLALGRQRDAGLTMPVARQIFARSLRLFALGFILANLSWLADFDSRPWRLFGILQRIALVYGICSMLYLSLSPRVRLWLIAAILLLYWPISLMPTLDAVPTDLWQRGMNFVSSVDRWLLGAGGHIYVKGPHGYDPEGLLSTLPSIAQVLIGIAVGEYLQRARGSAAMRGMLVAAAAMIAAGLLWGMVFPIVKDIWSSSFVLLTCGLTIAGMAIAHRFLDIPAAPGGVGRAVAAFALPFGVNAILIYVLHYILTPILTWEVMKMAFHGFAPLIGDQLAATLPSLLFIGFLWLIAAYMANKRWMVKI